MAIATPARKMSVRTPYASKSRSEFLDFSVQSGNDLVTPHPEFGFPGLKPGDRWCVCVARWREAFEAGAAPQVLLTATHEKALEVVTLDQLKRHAADLQ